VGGGLEGLAALPAKQRPLPILLTAYDHFAVRAFELQALDYLLKPVDDARFTEALERAREVLALRDHALAAPAQRRAGGRPEALERFEFHRDARASPVGCGVVRRSG